MANIHWKSAVSANFGTKADWVGGVVPGASDNAILDASGAAFTVTSNANETVSGIQTAANATLSISAYTFTATSGTGGGANAGTIAIQGGAKFAVGGTITNSGGINLAGSSKSGTAELLLTAAATLSGGGAVTLSDYFGNEVYASGAQTLTNIDNTISGAGYLGNSGLTLINQAKGLVDATGTNALVFRMHSVTNAGLIESAGAGGLKIESTIANSGTIQSTGAAVLYVGFATITNTGLVNAGGAGGLTLHGGTINDTGGGVTDLGSAATLYNGQIIGGAVTVNTGDVVTVIGYSNNLAIPTLTNQGAIDLGSGAGLKVQGAIVNSGGISLAGNSKTGRAELLLTAAATLSGGGAVTLSNYFGNEVYASGDQTLTNIDNTISGAGYLGNSGLTLINQAKGLVDGTGTNALVVRAASATNAGLIESTGAGGLKINHSIIANSGTIQSTGAGVLYVGFATITNTGGGVTSLGAATTLYNGQIIGGALTVNAGGAMTVNGYGNSLAPSSFTNLGTISLGVGSKLEVQGAIVNSGGINLGASSKGNAELLLTTATTLSGGGTVTLSDSARNDIYAVGTETLTNLDNTISGAGLIGNTGLTVINQAAGVIDATGTNVLFIKTGVHSITNAGIIEATGAGGLTVTGVTVVNSGTVAAEGAGAFTFTSGASLSNMASGTLVVGPAAIMTLQGGGLANLSGTTLTGGDYTVGAGGTLELANNSTITTLNATIALTGAGSTIQALNTTTSSQVTLEAGLTTIGAAGVLEILGGRNYTTTLALADAGTLQLAGGTLTAAGLTNTGMLSGYGVLATAFTNNGAVSVTGGQTLSLVGGTLTNLSGGTLTGGTCTIAAGGTLQLANNTSITDLDTVVDLVGAGSLVQGYNSGTSSEVSLESSLTTISSSGLLGIQAGRNYTGSNAIGNAGTIRLGGGTLTTGALTDVVGSVLNGFGTLASAFTDNGAVTSNGGTLAFTGAGDVFNAALGGTEIDFAGGTDALNAGSSLTAATVGLSGGAAVTLGASQSFSGAWNQGASTVNLGGFTLTLGGVATISGSIGGAGTLTFAGGTQALNAGASLTSGAWSVSSGAAASINANLAFNGALTEESTSSITIASGVTLSLGGSASVAGALGGTGDLALDSGASMTLAGNISFAGALGEAAGATLDLGTHALTLTGAGSTLAGAVTGTGTLALGTGASLGLGANLAFGGALSEASGASLALGVNTLSLTGAGTVLSGSVTGTGTLALAGGTQAIDAGATLSVSNWSLSGGVVSINESLGLAGVFAQGASSASIATGDTLSLTGTSTFGTGAVVDGAGTLALTNATIAGLTLGGTATVSDAGTVVQTGAITIGDTTSKAAKVSIAKHATWEIDGNVGIGVGASKSSSIIVDGTLIKTAGTGVSTVAPKVTDSGLIEAAAGTLDLAGAVAGKGALKIDVGATLQLASSAASTLTATFNGAGSTLALNKASKIAATIAGFTSGDTIDLIKTAATGASVNASDQLVIVDGTTTVATLQLAGTYTGDTFNVTSDGNKGSDITVTLGATGAPPARLSLFAQQAATLGARSVSTIAAPPMSSPPLANSIVTSHGRAELR